MKLFPFDTRDTKPKLWGLLLLTAVAASAAAILIAADANGNAGALCLSSAVYTFFAALILLYSFREQIRYNPYSYNTIFYFGFAVYSVFVWITHAALVLRLVRSPEISLVVNTFATLTASAKNYILLTSPFLLTFSVLLCISNIALIRKEGRRPVNMLGILLSFLLTAGTVFLYLFDYSFSGSELEAMIHDLVTNLFASVYLYFECMLVGTIVAEAVAARYQPEYDKDFLIVLGCGIRKDGTPTPILRGRLDKAMEFAKKQEEATGKKVLFVTSGGQGANEVVSESESMGRYLMENGIPEERILKEDRSRNTAENMAFSREKILETGLEGKVAYATTNYHVFRSGLLARRVKMRAVGMGAGTRWYFWPNASVREFAGLLTSHKGKQAMIFGTMIAFYLVLTFLAYRV